MWTSVLINQGCGWPGQYVCVGGTRGGESGVAHAPTADCPSSCSATCFLASSDRITVNRALSWVLMVSIASWWVYVPMSRALSATITSPTCILPTAAPSAATPDTKRWEWS